MRGSAGRGYRFRPPPRTAAASALWAGTTLKCVVLWVGAVGTAEHRAVVVRHPEIQPEPRLYAQDRFIVVRSRYALDGLAVGRDRAGWPSINFLCDRALLREHGATKLKRLFPNTKPRTFGWKYPDLTARPGACRTRAASMQPHGDPV